MDFEWTEQHNAFRQRLKDFLKANLPPDWEEKGRLDASSTFTAENGKAFCAKAAKAGLLIPHWPKEVGGEGLDAFHHWILGEEMVAAGEPRAYQYMNVNWIGPAILEYGTPAQIKTHIGLITAGDVYWCQGFSEPNAGSDLAAIATRAVKTANGWVINGSKIWTSGATAADYCFLLARTGEGKRSISAFMVPMKTPGIDCRVIAGVVGTKSLHEVFFTNVEVGHDALLGGEGDAWKIMKHVLHNERIGVPRYALALRAIERAVNILKQRGEFDDSSVRVRAVRAKTANEAARYQALQVIDGRVKGREPGPRTAIARYAAVLADRALVDFLGDHLMDVVMGREDIVIYAAYKRTASTGLGGGSAEMQLNGIARDHLALPRE